MGLEVLQGMDHFTPQLWCVCSPKALTPQAAQALCNCSELHKNRKRFYFYWFLFSIAFRITEVIFLKLSKKKYCVEAETELKATWVEQELSAAPSPCASPCSGSWLCLPCAPGRLCPGAGCAQAEEAWGSCTSGAVGKGGGIWTGTAPSPGSPWYLGAECISPFMPLLKEAPKSVNSLLSRVFCTLQQQQTLSKVQLRLGLQGLV